MHSPLRPNERTRAGDRRGPQRRRDREPRHEVAARRRFGLLPDTPVLDEGGIPLSAFIRRGIGVPVATPPDVTNPMIDAIHAAATDNAFDDQAEVGGYYAAWADGAAWLTQIQTEQAALAELWETNPWLSSSGG